MKRKIENTKKWFSDIEKIAAENGLGNPIAVEILKRIIFVESGGNANAQPFYFPWEIPTYSLALNKDIKVKIPNRATGLCQIQPATAWEYESKHLRESDLKDPNVNIRIGLKHLNKLLNDFPNPSLAVWAYHLGSGGMVQAIYEFVTKDLKLNKEEVDEIFKSTNPPGSTILVNAHDLNYAKLSQSQAVRLELTRQNLLHDKTTIFYTALVAAADRLLS